MQLPVETFRSAFRRTLPPIQGLGSIALYVPRAVDGAITIGSVQNAREAVKESALRHEAEVAIGAPLPPEGRRFR